MKKRFCISVLVLALFMTFFTGCGNNEANNENYENEENNSESVVQLESVNDDSVASGIAPEVITDLFDGERRLWFFIDYSDSFDGLAYDNDVKAVAITEDKQVLGYYYNLVGNKNEYMVGMVECSEPNPFFSKRFVLSDFEGLTDDEIISKVSETYGNAATEYAFNYEGKDYLFEACKFPYEIEYDGELDASGNSFKEEDLTFFKCAYNIQFTFNRSPEFEYISSIFHYSSIIKPTVIKDKEYVGIMDEKGNMLITTNNYLSFDHIGYDSIDSNVVDNDDNESAEVPDANQIQSEIEQMLNSSDAFRYGIVDNNGTGHGVHYYYLRSSDHDFRVCDISVNEDGKSARVNCCYESDGVNYYGYYNIYHNETGWDFAEEDLHPFYMTLTESDFDYCTRAIGEFYSSDEDEYTSLVIHKIENGIVTYSLESNDSIIINNGVQQGENLTADFNLSTGEFAGFHYDTEADFWEFGAIQVGRKS